MFLVAHVVDKHGAEPSDIINTKGVGKLSGTNAPELIGTIKGQIKFFKQIIGVDKKGHPVIVQIGLQDTVDTVHGAAHTDVKDMVVTTSVLFGSRTRLKKTATVVG